MKIHSSILLSLLTIALAASEAKLTVKALSPGCFDLEMPFNGEYKLVQELRPGRNGQLNFRRTTLMSPKRSYRIFYHSDDVAPWKLNDVYLGGNHGEPRCKLLTFKQPHGLAAVDRGTEFTDEDGKKFYLYQIRSAKQAVFIPENLGKKDRWYFSFSNPKGRLRGKTHTLHDYSVSLHQLFPALRFAERQYLADGKSVSPGENIQAKVFTVREVSDIIAPDAVLNELLDHPGSEIRADAPGLDSVLTQTITYTFTPDGRCVIDHQAEMKREAYISATGFVQAARLDSSGYATHRLIIEGVLPVDGIDFAAGIDYSRKLSKTIYIKREHCKVPGHFPVRFLQILEGNGAPSLGFAIGYMTDAGLGIPAERAKHTDTGLFLYHRTGKIYPWAINSKLFKPGEKIHCRTYRHYFVPEK
ncbi:MAG TPA: hypothetical protein DE060_16870 [Lentisphaeria bacterium]|nr:hypothetical protein [Lentisphaeria bacterium]HCG50865.1 hypothetical protein [Lentisphaeria bacterium]